MSFDKIYQSVQGFFWWCAGVEPNLLRPHPVDHAKYTGIGSLVTITGLFAGLAGGYAFATIFNSTFFAVMFGLFWGYVIFTLDRYVVASTGAGDGTSAISAGELWAATPRLALALVLGVSIATPVKLKIFEREIDAQLEATIEESRAAAQDALKVRYGTELDAVADQMKGIQARLNEMESDLRVRREARDIAHREYICEMEGTCGTGLRGDGPVFKMKQERLQGLQKELDAYLAEMNRSREALLKELGQLAAQRRKTEAALQDDFIARERVEEHNRGLLARINALGRLTSADWHTSVMSWVITLLFLAIEISPILFKMMTEAGPYLDEVERVKHESRALARLAMADVTEDVNLQYTLLAERNRQRLETELRTNEDLLRRIAEAQIEIGKTAVELWRKEQLALVKDDPGLVVAWERPAGGAKARAAKAGRGAPAKPRKGGGKPDLPPGPGMEV